MSNAKYNALLALATTLLAAGVILGIIASPAHAHNLNTNPKPRVCATVNNTTNTARWIQVEGTEYHAYVAHYAGDNVDRFGRLIYDAPVPRAVRLADAKLANGTPGPKIARACTY